MRTGAGRTDHCNPLLALNARLVDKRTNKQGQEEERSARAAAVTSHGEPIAELAVRDARLAARIDCACL